MGNNDFFHITLSESTYSEWKNLDRHVVTDDELREVIAVLVDDGNPDVLAVARALHFTEEGRCRFCLGLTGGDLGHRCAETFDQRGDEDDDPDLQKDPVTGVVGAMTDLYLEANQPLMSTLQTDAKGLARSALQQVSGELALLNPDLQQLCEAVSQQRLNEAMCTSIDKLRSAADHLATAISQLILAMPGRENTKE